MMTTGNSIPLTILRANMMLPPAPGSHNTSHLPLHFMNGMRSIPTKIMNLNTLARGKTKQSQKCASNPESSLPSYPSLPTILTQTQGPQSLPPHRTPAHQQPPHRSGTSHDEVHFASEGDLSVPLRRLRTHQQPRALRSGASHEKAQSAAGIVRLSRKGLWAHGRAGVQ